MERLTNKYCSGDEYYMNCPEDCDIDDCGGCIKFDTLVNKLGEYEDAEEHGLLVRLPCKVGDAIFYLNPFGEIENGRITMIQQKANGTWKFRVTTDFSHDVTTDAFGTAIFLTRAEAEAALTQEGQADGTT